METSVYKRQKETFSGLQNQNKIVLQKLCDKKQVIEKIIEWRHLVSRQNALKVKNDWVLLPA